MERKRSYKNGSEVRLTEFRSRPFYGPTKINDVVDVQPELRQVTNVGDAGILKKRIADKALHRSIKCLQRSFELRFIHIGCFLGFFFLTFEIRHAERMMEAGMREGTEMQLQNLEDLLGKLTQSRESK